MRYAKAALALVSAAVVTVTASGLWIDRAANAADHLDPPSRTDIGANSDTAADIADVFAWNNDTTVTIIVTGAGPSAPNLPAFYDRNVLYQVHLSNDGDPTTTERDINIRFGKDAAGNWGVQFTGIPGSSGAVTGPVQTTLIDGTTGVRATAGLFDDPFFFDLEGFRQTMSTGTLSIRKDRDIFDGKNDTSLVIEFPRAAIANGTNPLNIWAETRRIQGS